MARARNIKPGFFTNDDLVELPFEYRLLFIGLWTIADKEGRLNDRPKKIRMEIFPADDVDCDKGLGLLAEKGFIRRYEVQGARYIQIVNWHKHQNPHMKEAASVIPAENGRLAGVPDLAPEIPVQAPEFPVQASEIPEGAGLIPDSGFLIPDSLNRIPDTGCRTPEKNLVEQKTLDRAEGVPEIIFGFWQKVMASPKSALDKKRRVLIETALKSYSPADVCKAIRGCSKSPFNMGRNDRNTKYNGLNLILRDAEHIDHFINLDSETAKPAVETVEEMNARIAAEFLGTPQNDDNTIDMEP